jgi:hypothetical protein
MRGYSEIKYTCRFMWAIIKVKYTVNCEDYSKIINFPDVFGDTCNICFWNVPDHPSRKSNTTPRKIIRDRRRAIQWEGVAMTILGRLVIQSK